MKSFSWSGFGLRLVFALLLVFLTYNPSGYSYLDWLISQLSEPTPWLALAGIVLVIGWVVYVRATLRSLGPVGLVLISIMVGVLIWALVDIGLIALDGTSALVWLIELFVALVLAVGMSWSHIRRRMSGQIDVDDIEE